MTKDALSLPLEIFKKRLGPILSFSTPTTCVWLPFFPLSPELFPFHLTAPAPPRHCDHSCCHLPTNAIPPGLAQKDAVCAQMSPPRVYVYVYVYVGGCVF